MINKIKKFLLKNGATLTDDCAESKYFDYCKQKIRVSNHAPLAYFSNDLLIIWTDSEFVVILYRTVKVYPNIRKLYDFLRNYLFITKAFVSRIETAKREQTFINIKDVEIDEALYNALPAKQQKKIKERIDCISCQHKALLDLINLYKDKYGKNLN